MATSSLPSWVSPVISSRKKSEKAKFWARWRHKPCFLGGPQALALGENPNNPKFGENGYIILAFLGFPITEHKGKLKGGYFTPPLSGARI